MTFEARTPIETAHILFMDIVGFSRQSLDQQAALVTELRRIVEATGEYRNAMQRKELVCREVGDGIALVFFHDLVAPAQCAVEISREVRGGAGIRLRMGIHSGPVSRQTDLSGRADVTGDGINLAQRVMDCGETGHILLSHSYAEVLLRLEEWKQAVHPLGDYTVKHGESVRLYNFHNDKTGNVAIPTKRETAATEGSRAGVPVSAAKPAEALGLKVALLYKRNQRVDGYLLDLLERELAAHGCTLFIDRHLSVGVEWAREIERQVCDADAVIPLLSEAALHSEMLEYELQTAYREAQKHGGKPRILPVRIAYTGPLPESLATILDPLQYTLWNSSDDDTRLVAELVDALREPPPPLEIRETVFGAVPLDSPFYIERPVDNEFRQAIERHDSIIRIYGARQMGKTSLLARGLQQARERGERVVCTDFQALAEADFESTETFLMALARSLKVQLELDVSIKRFWDEDLPANMNLEMFLRKHILNADTRAVVWGMDEVDRLFTCAFGSEVFGLIRSWHNKRALDPYGPWSRLTLAIGYATEAHLFISDLNQSPFNVGTNLALKDFDAAQVAELNRRYGRPLPTPDDLERFMRLVGGQPYLVRRGLDEMAKRGLNVTDLERTADTEESLFGDHLRRILVSLSRDEELLEGVQGVLTGKGILSTAQFYRLRSAGILTGDSAPKASFRCRLYASYLARHLL